MSKSPWSKQLVGQSAAQGWSKLGTQRWVLSSSLPRFRQAFPDTVLQAEIHGAALAREVDHANLTLIEGAGHMPHHSHPLTVIEALRRIDRAA